MTTEERDRIHNARFKAELSLLDLTMISMALHLLIKDNPGRLVHTSDGPQTLTKLTKNLQFRLTQEMENTLK